MKHFNKGTIWGRIRDLKLRKTKGNSKPYADLRIVCPSERYGDVLAFGRLWGAEKVEALTASFKADPDTPLRFRGNLDQFKDEGRTLTGFHLFTFEPAPGAAHRAVFVLVGEVAERDFPEEDRALLGLAVRQGGKETFFQIFAEAGKADAVHVGDTARVKGAMRDVDAWFGGSGDVRPFAEEITVLEKGGMF